MPRASRSPKQRLTEPQKPSRASIPPALAHEREAADIVFRAHSCPGGQRFEAGFAGEPFDIIVQPLVGR
jgi:hypothetical protein